MLACGVPVMHMMLTMIIITDMVSIRAGALVMKEKNLLFHLAPVSSIAEGILCLISISVTRIILEPYTLTIFECFFAPYNEHTLIEVGSGYC